MLVIVVVTVVIFLVLVVAGEGNDDEDGGDRGVSLREVLDGLMIVQINFFIYFGFSVVQKCIVGIRFVTLTCKERVWFPW